MLTLFIQGGLIRLIIVPLLAALFAVLPLKVQPKSLIPMAFALWLLGGGMLLVAGASRLASLPTATWLTAWMMGGLVVAVVIGLAKGRFILSKTSQRNLERIQRLHEPQKLVHVYSLRSWIIIELMLVLSAALTWFNTPVMARGLVNIAVGLALVASSRAYWMAFQAQQQQANSSPAQ